MFSKRNSVDVKKSTLKLQDPKKDLATRIKHLKIILDNVDNFEAKGVLEANFSHVYNILYDSFIQAESNLRQKELSFHLVHKAHKEELDCSLWILEQVVCLLPELIHKRWQLHSLGRLLSKLLHHGNALKYRKQGIKYFLMWYQALNDNAPEYVHNMFATLVPGFNNPIHMHSTGSGITGGSVFHDGTSQNPVTPGELLPIFPPSNEKPPENPSNFFLDILLENMLATVVKLEWHDKQAMAHRCFYFLLERFKMYYLPKMVPGFCKETSLYIPDLDLPILRKMEPDSEMVHCRVAFIIWLVTIMQQTPKKYPESTGPGSLAPGSGSEQQDDSVSEHTHTSLDSTVSSLGTKTDAKEQSTQVIKDVLCSNRDNVNFLHEMYRQGLLLNFNHVFAVRKVISVYKDLIQTTKEFELPVYAMEPPEDVLNSPNAINPQLAQQNLKEETESTCQKKHKLRNDSFFYAVSPKDTDVFVKAGLQNVYQLFMTHAANVFMVDVNSGHGKLLEEQVDACKRVLNIYRYMVMNNRMDSNTWEQLLLVLLQITSLVLGEAPIKRKKSLTLGGKLAQPIFQTLIVTWIKANLNVSISRELWDKFLYVLQNLTNWEELIREWAKTLETLTRVLARHVYNLDLTDLPLDRQKENKNKRSMRMLPSGRENSGTKPKSNQMENKSNRKESENKHFESNSENRDNLSKETVEESLSVLDGESVEKKTKMFRSLSESCLNKKNKDCGQELLQNVHTSTEPLKKSKSQPTLNQNNQNNMDTASFDRTRSPSPTISNNMENNSLKDSPIQLDVMSGEHLVLDQNLQNIQKGIVCGGNVRGWTPDVAVILWKRMLGSLGDVNSISDPKLHAQVFEYLVKLTETLIKIQLNQGVSLDNITTPDTPDLIPPLTLVLPWCFGALLLPRNTFQNGKLQAVKLLCIVTTHSDPKHRQKYLPSIYRFLHNSLVEKTEFKWVLKHLGPRFLSLRLPGSSLLLLDIVHSCNLVLNEDETSAESPRKEAVEILGNLLSLKGDFLGTTNVLRPENDVHVMVCPDLKDHVVEILLRAGKREPKGKARCIALTALGMFVYKELHDETFHNKIPEVINVLIAALKQFTSNKSIVQLTSNIMFSLCDHAPLMWGRYPRNCVVQSLCSALFLHYPRKAASQSEKALCTSLLLCLGEWCMKLGPEKLMERMEYGEEEYRGKCLLLQVFTVLHNIITNNVPAISEPKAKNLQNQDFDSNIISSDHRDFGEPVSDQHRQAVVLCAKSVLAHLVTHLGHFPMAIGAARLSSLVLEHDDVPNLVQDDLNAGIFTSPNIQLFILNKNVIASLVELPTLELPGGGVNAGLSTADKQVRVLLRDLSGKSSWDASILYRNPSTRVPEEEFPQKDEAAENMSEKYGPMSFWQQESMITTGLSQNFSNLPMRHRNRNVLPEVGNAAPDLDQLDDLLQYLGHTSSECLEDPNRKLNEPAKPPITLDLEQEAIQSVIGQRNLEMEECKYLPNSTRFHQRIPQVQEDQTTTAFKQCRLLFSQLGLAGWEKRQALHLLNKGERLLRELRNLDSQSCRETHKIAVIYVNKGQEDKNSILSNQGGSKAYEDFLGALAWEVELEAHTGFVGGLNKGGKNGLTAPYVASSFFEAIFHVATRMPGDSPEDVLSKTRHLGNDEVHIVWSEHWRDYRRDIIPTEFCDVLIVIYPLGDNLNRVTINCKKDVPLFGVLYDEVIVASDVLAGLIRATALCASRAKRSTYQLYQQYYEERARSLETVVTKHKNSTTYEDFISSVYSPVLTPFLNSNNLSGSSYATADSSNLASALIDTNARSRFSQKGIFTGDSSKGVWFNSNFENNVESTSISPRPLKKLSNNLKSSKRSLRHENSVESPPESPIQMTRRK